MKGFVDRLEGVHLMSFTQSEAEVYIVNFLQPNWKKPKELTLWNSFKN